MFSGIIYHQGKFFNLRHENGLKLITISVPTKFISKLKIGASVAVSGVCLTLLKKSKQKLSFEVMPETLLKTTLASKQVGQCLNLEPSLRAGDEMGGHWVYGHVDAVGLVEEFTKGDGGVFLSIRLPKELLKYIVEKGSITIDGVSLTIVSAKNGIVTVSLVEYTLKNTTIGALQIGDEVNIECDMLAKYVAKISNL